MISVGYGNMQLVLKNNADLRPIRRGYKEIVDRFYKPRTIKAEYKEATPRLLSNIRKRLKEEKKIRNRKVGVVFLSMLGVMLYAFSSALF